MINAKEPDTTKPNLPALDHPQHHQRILGEESRRLEGHCGSDPSVDHGRFFCFNVFLIFPAAARVEKRTLKTRRFAAGICSSYQL
jgi:hypothetical protein